MAEMSYSERSAKRKTGEKVWKINPKRKDTAAVSKVKSSLLKTNPNQTHGG